MRARVLLPAVLRRLFKRIRVCVLVWFGPMRFSLADEKAELVLTGSVNQYLTSGHVKMQIWELDYAVRAV